MTQGVVSGEGTATDITPSGIEVRFESKPKRRYLVRQLDQCRDCLVSDGLNDVPKEWASRCSDCPPTDWREVPSVTTVLGVLDKPALPWWGMKVGVEGTLKLFRDLHISFSTSGDGVLYGPSWGVEISDDDVVALLTEHKLTVNHVRDKAGDRGQAVHDAFEAWARTGLKPDPSVYPDEERGYVEGLLAFLADVPSIEPLACEVLVASVEYGFAGRYDIRFRTYEPHDVVVHRTPKKGPQYRRLAPGTYLGDLKTSKGTYPSHARQLEAYEQASIESGYEPTEARGILHVGPDGTYEFVRSWATFADFACVLAVWQSDQEMKGRR